MPTTEDIKRHADLVDRMVTTLGIDLEDRMLAGALDFTRLENAVLGCTACTQSDACETWLAGTASPAARPPGYCRNADLFAKLAKLPTDGA
ncbi:DUF6455 family protein [Salipiger sp.]|uniref:DUF6455 family protein n=1 Tax=Salipiger sp. TaxID=2078585 RepID=UPI003A96B370